MSVYKLDDDVPEELKTIRKLIPKSALTVDANYHNYALGFVKTLTESNKSQ
jgi:hypothetical protein